MSPSSHESKDKSITITSGTPSDRICRLNTKAKDSVRWQGADRAYEVWFKNADWAFKRAADRDETSGYKVVAVPHGKDTHKYTLDYELEEGGTREHPYEIRIPGVVNGGGGPSGPTIIGEG